MAFNVELEPATWKKFAKEALKKEVYGGGQNKTSLVELLNSMELRQHRWHAMKDMHTKERERIFGAHDACRNRADGATCLRMVNQIRAMVDAMAWE